MNEWIDVNEKPEPYTLCWVKGKPYANKEPMLALAIHTGNAWFSPESTFGWLYEIGDDEALDADQMNVLDNINGWQYADPPK